MTGQPRSYQQQRSTSLSSDLRNGLFTLQRAQRTHS
jgi:hypothetical protein